MIFAQIERYVECPDCAFRKGRYHNNSIVLLLAMVVVGTGATRETIATKLPPAWWHWPAALLVSIAVVLVLSGAPEWLRHWLSPLPKRCPRCGASGLKERAGRICFQIVPCAEQVLTVLAYIGWLALLVWWRGSRV